MKKTIGIIVIGIACVGCKKGPAVAVPTAAPAPARATAKPPEPTRQALTPLAPVVDPEIKEEKAAREAAEQMLSDWRAGNKSPNLMAMDLVDKGILLDYKIVSFQGRTGTVNLSLQTEDGPPAQRQYSMIVDRQGNTWKVFLAHR